MQNICDEVAARRQLLLVSCMSVRQRRDGLAAFDAYNFTLELIVQRLRHSNAQLGHVAESLLVDGILVSKSVNGLESTNANVLALRIGR
jgi:hypothetical protein